MNRAIQAAIILLAASSALSVTTYTIPPQFLSISSCFPANTYVQTVPSIVVDLDGYAKSLGKDSLVWLSTFTASINYNGFKFEESAYVMSASSNDYATWCPSGSANCQGSSILSVTLRSRNLFIIALNNPRNSILYGNQGFYMAAANFVLPSGDKLVVTKTVICSPGIIATSNVTLNTKNFMEVGCVSWLMSNNLNQIQRDPYNTLILTPKIFNPLPIPGGAVNQFTTNNSTLSINGIPLNIAPVAVGNSYYFTAALNFSQTTWSNTPLNFTLCNVYAPPAWSSSMNLTLVDSTNRTLGVGIISSKSQLGLKISDSPLVQSTTAFFASVVMSLAIKGTTNYNFADSYQLRFVFPSSYSGIIPIKVTVKSLYDGSSNVVDYVMTTPIFVLPMPKQNIFMFLGMTLQIEGLANPMFPGNYPLTVQLLSSSGQPISEVISRTILSTW